MTPGRRHLFLASVPFLGWIRRLLACRKGHVPACWGTPRRVLAGGSGRVPACSPGLAPAGAPGRVWTGSPLPAILGVWVCLLAGPVADAGLVYGSGVRDSGDRHLDPSPLFDLAVPDEEHEAEDLPWPQATPEAADEAPIRVRTTNRNLVGLAVWNTGFFGTNFASMAPSFEYPLGETFRYDHMVRGGLWVGGLVDTSGVVDTLVSTATIDGSYGSDPRTASEFAARDTILEISRIRGAYYSPNARSQQDFRTSFSDRLIRDLHAPLGVDVYLETLVWDYDPFRSMVVANFTIVNTNAHPIQDVALGFYSELATGYKDPSQTNPFSGWFDNKDIEAVDSVRVVMEHRHNTTYPWAGLVLLGTDPPLGPQACSFSWWEWTVDEPENDAARYRAMTTGLFENTDGFEASADPVEVLSAGPFPGFFYPGDSLRISFAFVGGRPDPRTGGTARLDLLANAKTAQDAYNANFDVPVPPPSPTVLIQPGRNQIRLRWKDDPEFFEDPKSGLDFEGYRVYIAESRADRDARLIMEADVLDSVFFNTGLDALRDTYVAGSDTFDYRYDIDNLRDGFRYWTAVTSFDAGGGPQNLPSLESGRTQNRTLVVPGDPTVRDAGSVKVFPNPYRGDAAWDGSISRDRYLWFINLPPRCNIRIFTLAGDLVDTIHFDSATYHATEIRGIFDPTDRQNPEGDIPLLSGNMAAWDLISREDQGVASGLYIFSVEDLDRGNVELGKFLILK